MTSQSTDIFPPDKSTWEALVAARDAQPAAPWTDEERTELLEFNSRTGAAEHTLAHIEALGKPKTLMVVAGQQCGLFLSPLYIVYKAMGAIRWAGHLSETLGREVVPAFWIASDDHDFAEINKAGYLDKNGALQAVTYDRSDTAARSAFDLPADTDALLALVETITAETRETEFSEPVLEMCRAVIRHSENLEDLFAAFLRRAVASGLMLIPSRLGTLRRRAVPIIAREVEQPGVSSRKVLEAGKNWTEGNAPLHRHGDEVNFFVYREGIRCKVTWKDERFVLAQPDGGKEVAQLDTKEMRALLSATPEAFSPNVITRPLVQDTALPVLAMIGGPGEQRYLRQLREAGVPAFHEAFASHVLPRPRAVLVEPRIERLLDKYGIGDALLEREDCPAMREMLMHAGGGGVALDAVEDLRGRAEAAFDGLPERMGPVGARGEVSDAARKTGQAWQKALDKFEQRVRGQISQTEKTAQEHLAKMCDALHPNGVPQERVLGPLAPFMLNYGPQVTAWIAEHLDINRDTLQVLRLSQMLATDPEPEK